MKQVVWVFIVGALLILGSCAPFGIAIKKGMSSNEVYTLALQPGQAANSEVFEVDASREAELAIRMDIHSDSVVEQYSDGEDKYNGRFAFPLQYALYNEAGQLIHQERKILEWNSGGRTYYYDYTTREQAELAIKTDFYRFQPSQPGRYKVSITLLPDTRYHATASNVELVVQDQLERYASWVWYGVSLLGAGFIAMLLGLIMTIVTSTRPAPVMVQQTSMGNRTGRDDMTSEGMHEQSTAAGTATTGGADSVSSRPAADKNILLGLHLSQLANYLIPFAGVIAPLVIWLSYKDQYPRVAEEGKLVMNFRISMLIYELVAVILMFVLIGFFLFFGLVLFEIIIIIIAAMRVSEGGSYRYPLAITFLK